MMKSHRVIFGALAVILLIPVGESRGQLFENLRAASSRIALGNPSGIERVSPPGPKGLATADFDADGNADIVAANADGSVDVLFGDGEGNFSSRLLLEPIGGELNTLRGIVAADFNGDSRVDIATADPFNSMMLVYLNSGARTFAAAQSIATWAGARDLVADDFDADGDVDLVLGGYTVGLRLMLGDGAGSFTPGGDVSELSVPATGFGFTPVYTLRSFRPTGSALPKLAATHANTTTLWILGLDSEGVMQVEASLFTDVENPDYLELHDFAIAPVSGPLSSAVPDLVTVSKKSNRVTVWRGSSSAPYFFEEPYQQFPISGGPRSVHVADVDHDGWGDLGIVVRNLNRVLVYGNEFGLLEKTAELHSSESPRDLVMPDMNGDDCADIVVINRKSRDLKLHITDPEAPGGFEVPRQLYATDADPAGLAVADLGNDGRDDVIQLHRASGDVSVRASNPDGSLGDPVYYPMGVNSNSMTVKDLNSDGQVDVSVANLGRLGSGGTLTVRFGDGVGGLGELMVVTPPTDPGTGGGEPLAPGVFALVQADLDGDGIEDQAVGYYDCRVAFFQGLENGGYEHRNTVEFAYESRVMVAGDFDQDDDIDIAGMGADGDGVVLINDGTFFTETAPRRNGFGVSEEVAGDLRSAVLADLDGNDDPDIVITSAAGLLGFAGGGGATFVPVGLIGEGNPSSSVASGDFDGDDDQDFAVGRDDVSRLSIYAASGIGSYGLALEIDVPSAAYIASGDVDGDGKADLVGTGSVLWTALSGSSPPPARLSATARPQVGALVINEILPKNDTFAIEEDALKRSDAVEIFNASGAEVDLQGWRLQLLTPDGETREFTVPEAVGVADGTRGVFVCRKGESAMHTGFKLPAEGGKVTLLDAAGTVVDEVVYPAMDADISLARYGDANSSFYFNAYPDIGSSNLDNGLIDPDIKFRGVSPASPVPDQPLTFHVTARDDVGLASLGVTWRRLNGTSNESGWLPLFDDGMHGDGGMLDGEFAGTFENGFPDGAQIEFYIRGIDLSNAEQTEPNSPMFSIPGMPLSNFSLSVGEANNIGRGLQVSEVVASNDGSIIDEAGEADDWIELRNTSVVAVSLDGLGLGQSTSPDPGELFVFPDGMMLQPGEYVIIWADKDEEQGPLHAPFNLSADGELVTLIGTTDLGATAVANSLSWGPLESGESMAVIGVPGREVLRVQVPTPGAANIASDAIELLSVEVSGELSFAFLTGEPPPGGGTSRRWELESSTALSGWQFEKAGPLDGAEQVFSVLATPGEQRFYRVRRFTN